MKKIVFLVALACFLTSCNVTESIVFNKNMGGEYTSSFDMSPMLEYANASRPASKERPVKEKIDTTIVFSDFYKTHKDSIDGLSELDRARFEKLKGMVMTVNMDEEKSIFEFNMSKSFKTISDLESINDELDEAMGIATDLGNKDGQAPKDQIDKLAKTEQVVYSFKGNTFSRFQPDSVEKDSDNADEDEEGEKEKGDDFGKQLEMQFEEVFSTSYYTLVYKFSRKVKSVSNKDATISEDRKTVIYEVPWNVLQKDATLMNLDIILED